jgi:hypothetical protein
MSCRITRPDMSCLVTLLRWLVCSSRISTLHSIYLLAYSDLETDGSILEILRPPFSAICDAQLHATDLLKFGENVVCWSERVDEEFGRGGEDY